MAKITFKGKPVTTNGILPHHNADAPDFDLVDRELHDRSLKDYKGKRKVLVIVPSLDTSVCSTMGKKFNDAVKSHPEVTALLISADLPFAQQRFCESHNAHNIRPLSMMRSKDFAKDYGVLMMDGPLRGICARAVVVLDAHDKVVYTELVHEITEEPDYDKAIDHLLRK